MAYVKKFEYSFYDFYDTIHYGVELLQDGGDAGSTSIQYGGSDPLQYKISKVSRSDNDIVYGSEMTFTFAIDRSDISDYNILFESQYKEWRLDIYKDTVLDWTGYITPENLKRSLVDNRLQIQVSAIDGLKDLANEEFRDNGQLVIGQYLILPLIKIALTPIGIELPFKIQLNTYEYNYGTSTVLCLYDNKVFADRFSREENGKTEVDSCLTVIEKLLKDFNVILRQVDGVYRIEAKHERATYEYNYNWALGYNGRTSYNRTVYTDGWKVEGNPSLSLVSPLKKVEITHRNRNIGNAVVENLDDWTSGGSPWNIPVSVWFGGEYTEDSGETLVLPDEEGQYPSARYITLNDDFALTKVTDSDYVKVTARVKIRNTDSDYSSNDYYSVCRIVIEHVGTSQILQAGVINLSGSWAVIESKNVTASLIIASGDFNVYIQFESIGSGSFSCEYLIRDVFISKVTVQEGDEIIEDISYDEFHQLEFDNVEGREVEEIETFFGDTGQANDLGGIYANDSAENNTSLWRRYGETTSSSLIESYGEALLVNRQRYKEFIINLTYIDTDDELRPNSIISFEKDGDSRFYRILSFSKSFRFNKTTLRLEEVLYGNVSYQYTKVILTSVDGQGSGGSTTVGGSGGSFSLLDHNNIIGGLHLDTGERTQWDTAYNERHQWDGGATNLVAATGRTSLGLGTAALFDANSITSEYLIRGGSGSSIEGTRVFISQVTNSTYLGVTYGTTSNRLWLVALSSSVGRLYQYISGTGYGDVYIGDMYALYIHANKNISINTDSDSGHNLNINGSVNVGTSVEIGTTADIEGILTAKSDVGSESFVSGFAGNGWRLEIDSSGDNTFTVDNLYVRKSMTVYELIINKIRATNGSLWVTDAVQIDTASQESTDVYYCTIDNDDGNKIVPFAVNDIVRCQKFDGRNVKYYSATVLSVDSDGEGFTIEVIDGEDGTNEPEEKDTLVRIGNSSDSNRQGSVYITASDSNAPYLDVLDEVTSYTFVNKTKVRLGKLTGITDPNMGSLSGYGLYTNNAYLTGTIYSDSGEIGGWTISENLIDSGDIYLSSIMNVSSTSDTNYEEIGQGLYIKTGTSTNDEIAMIQIGDIYPMYSYATNLCQLEFLSASPDKGFNVLRYQSRPDGYGTTLFRIDDEGGLIAGFQFDEDQFYQEYLSTIVVSVYPDADSTSGGVHIEGGIIAEDSRNGGYNDSPAKFYNLDSSNSTPVVTLYQGASGSDRKVLRVYSDYDSAGGTDEGGLQIYNGTLQIQQGSDINRKKVITPINTGLSIINKLNPVEYLWKDDRKNPENNIKLAGLIAQEVEKILPNMVSTSEEGEKFININYPIPYLIAAIQELTNQVKQLKIKEK